MPDVQPDGAETMIESRGRSGIDQIGFVVDDLSSSMTTLGGALGVRAWYRSKMSSFELHYRDRPTTIDWDIVVGYSGRVQVELILVREAGPRGEPLRELVRIYYAARFGGAEVQPDRPAALIRALEPLPRRGRAS